jgi:DNA-binding transcriptional LysR family regulator
VNVSSINLNLLAALDALISERSVTRAATRLGVTQSAMSNSLQRLRELYDDPLFHRVGRGIVPTPRALAIGRPLREGLALLGSTLSTSSFEPAKADRTFVLALSDYVEFVLVPPLLRRLADVAPNIRIVVVPWGLHEIPPTLASGEVDLMIGFYDRVPPRHEERILFSDEYVCLVRKNHPRVGAKLTLEKYLELDHVIVSQTRDSVGSVDVALGKMGKKRRVGARVSHFLMVPRLIADTDFVAAISRRAAEPFVKTFGLRIFPAPLPLPVGRIGQVWHAREAADPAALWLRETIAEIAKAI